MCFRSTILALCLAACASDTGDMAESSIAVTGIELPQTLRLDTARVRSARLTASVTPAKASAVLRWSSDAPAVASVDASGIVSAVGPGKATISAATDDGAVRASCTVYVFALWLDDTFEDQSTARWDLRPPSGPDGAFSVISDGEQHVLHYAAKMTGGVLATSTDAAFANVPGGDYYVEARVKPLTNGTTGNKQLYFIARYQDDANWYAAGLNVQSSTSSTQAEIAKMTNGALARPVQVKTPIVLDTTWYTVRFELQGSTLSVYLDGVLLKSTTDAQWSSGKVGLFTANKSFDIDDIRVGDPKDRPVQLAIDATTWTTEAKSDAKLVHVTARKPSYEDGT